MRLMYLVSGLYKKVIRVIAKVENYAKANVLFKELRILKFLDLVKYKMGVFMYKASCHAMPKNIVSIYSKHSAKDCHILRSQGKLKNNYVRTNLIAHTLAILGVQLFSDITDEIKKAKSVILVKNVEKTIT